MLEKDIWTEKDFAAMGWHDATIWGLAFLPESRDFVLDIDYIVKWVSPEEEGGYFRFWVAPATLVFHDVCNLCLDIEFYEPWVALLDDVERTEPDVVGDSTQWLWILNLHDGEISCRAAGFHQYFRRQPVLSDSQSLPLDGRGGISFNRSTPSGG